MKRLEPEYFESLLSRGSGVIMREIATILADVGA